MRERWKTKAKRAEPSEGNSVGGTILIMRMICGLYVLIQSPLLLPQYVITITITITIVIWVS